MSESQYTDSYLDYCAGGPVTVRAYLQYALKGDEKNYADVHELSLIDSLERRVQDGRKVRRCGSVGNEAYIRID